MKLMQLPSLYLRGSMANQTMSGLTEAEIRKVDGIVRMVEDDPCLAGDKHEFIRQLGATIKADYRSDPATALQEYRIAIWRATVQLLFHRDYQYNCAICGASSYITCTGNLKVIDRQFKMCPQCQQAYIDEERRVIVTNRRERSQYVVVDGEGKVYGTFNDKLGMKKILVSPINIIPGTRKINNPDEILSDNVQRGKWYTVWIWNYFRQTLNENIIRTHNKHEVSITGSADYIASQLVISQLKRYKSKFVHSEEDGLDEIQANIMALDRTFSEWLGSLIREFSGLQIRIEVPRKPDGWASIVRITHSKNAPIITRAINIEDPVVMLSFGGPANGEDDDNQGWRDVVEYNSDGQIYDGEIDKFISDEAMSIVRTHLIDDGARKTFDILSQTGETWAQFSNQWGQQPARKVHIAKFLNITTRQVDFYKQMIMTQCLIHDLKSSRKGEVDKHTLSVKMRACENELCRDIRGDIFRIIVLYRYLCLHILNGSGVIAIDRIPTKLLAQTTREQYQILAERVKRFV